MIQRDFLLRQAEMFAQAMAKLLARLLGTDTQQERMLMGNEAFCQMFGLEINDLLKLPADDLITLTVREKKFDTKNVEQLADIFSVLSENAADTEKDRLKAGAMALYDYAEQQDNCYSFSRAWKMERLKEV